MYFLQCPISSGRVDARVQAAAVQSLAHSQWHTRACRPGTTAPRPRLGAALQWQWMARPPRRRRPPRALRRGGEAPLASRLQAQLQARRRAPPVQWQPLAHQRAHPAATVTPPMVRRLRRWAPRRRRRRPPVGVQPSLYRHCFLPTPAALPPPLLPTPAVLPLKFAAVVARHTSVHPPPLIPHPHRLRSHHPPPSPRPHCRSFPPPPLPPLPSPPLHSPLPLPFAPCVPGGAPPAWPRWRRW